MEALEAEKLNRKRRLALRPFIRIDESKVTPEDRELVERFRAQLTGDGEKYDEALAHAGVNDLFVRGVLHIGRPAPQ